MEILKNRLPWLFAHNKQQPWERMLKEQKKILDAILLHNYKKLSFHEKKEACTLFDAWQQIYRALLSESTPDVDENHNLLLKKPKEMYLYKPHLFSDNPPSQENAEMFLKDVFTSAYPSTHDMDDWAMHMRFAELMTLKGISKNDAKKYYVHLKKRFVNHTIVKGIIQMDIYCLK